MANHRATDGTACRYTVLDSSDRRLPGHHPSQHLPTARAIAHPASRTVVTPVPHPTPAPDAVTRTTAMPAGAAQRSDPADLRATSARRSSADEIAARATTTLIPNSPGDRAKAGPIFVDGSGRRARRFKGLAVAAATLAAGYVGVVVTGALAGSTGPVGGTAAPVANGASLAPAAAPVVPSPILATPADATTTEKTTTTTKAPATKRTTTPKKVAPRTTAPKKVVPVPVAPAPAPVVPAPAAPKTQPPAENTVPKEQQPQEPAAAEKPATLQNT